MQTEPSKSDQSSEKKSLEERVQVLSFLSLLLLYILIILYAIFSQSIFSFSAVIALLLSLFVNIAKPAHLALRDPGDQVFEWNKVILYPFDKIIWIMFIVINAAFFIFKVAVYYSGVTEDWSDDLKRMLEVQSPLYVFLPLVLFPFAAGVLFHKQKSKMLKEYSKKINPNIALPLYLLLGSLIILNQIFSPSIAGLIYFFLAIYLFWMKTYNFKDSQFKILLYFVQVITMVMIVANYFTTIELVQTEESVKMFKLFGIISIEYFMDNYQNRGHIICQVLLSLLAAYLIRLVNYQYFNSLCVQESSDLDEIIAGKEMKETQRELIGKSGIFVAMNRTQSDIERERTNKVFSHARQVEMRNLSFRIEPPNFKSDAPPRQTQQEVQNQLIFNDVIKLEQEVVDEQQPIKKRDLVAATEKKLGEIKKYLLEIVHLVFNFFNSAEFSLRVIEIISIIVIQRFNNIYSFVALIWLAIVSSVENPKFVMIVTGCVLLPFELANYVLAFFYNMDQSPAAGITGKDIYGFEVYHQLWLDVLIFNLYFHYIILYLKSYQKLKQLNFQPQKKFTGKPKTWELFLGFLFKYSYMLTMIGMFFLGFSNPTLINFIFVALFLIFFSKGDTIIVVQKSRNGRLRSTLTTFSKKYWFIIVYFTLLCILAKYIYFLFFYKQGDENRALKPSGISQIYEWSFNFSLSSDCKSNTTPLFIIFVLAQIQIIISRSYIYKFISFSIMNYIDQDTKLKPETTLEQGKRKLISVVVAISQIYYQSLYYISGIIIVACSYRWCLISLPIIVLTIMGLFLHFSKKLIGLILLLNLIFLFGNYLIILINNYPIIRQWLGSGLMSVIDYITLLIAFQNYGESYAKRFILNVVNFYFVVLCYSLANVLDTTVTKSLKNSTGSHLEDSESSHGSRSPNDLKESLNVEDAIRSYFARSIVGSQFDEHFAENYKSGTISQIQKYYRTDLIRKYEWIRRIGTFLVYFWTDIVAIFVIISCLFFRISLSMLLFLILYMVFYFLLFDKLGNLFRTSGYYHQIESQLKAFRIKQGLLEDEQNFKSLIDDREMLVHAEMQMRLTEQNGRLLKNQYKKRIWKFSSLLTALCLILTYASQFINSDFYAQQLNFEFTQTLQKILFITGINVNPGGGIGSFIYFYYVMVIITVIEKLVIQFITRMALIAAQGREDNVDKSIKELKQLQNTDYLINTHVSEPFIEECRIFEEMEAGVPREMGLANALLSGLMGQNYCQQANVLIYFDYRYAQMKISILYGLLIFIIRLYLWLMLLNVYAKSNVFSFLYFLAVVFFWFKSVEFDLIRNINKAAIVILCLQYLVLLLDLNSVVSPLPLPYGDNTISLLEHFISDTNLVNFIAVSSQEGGSNSSFIVSFIVNAIIIFFTQLCFTIFTVLSEQMMKSIFEVYLKYEFILQKIKDIQAWDPVIINYNEYKHLPYRALNFIYERIFMGSYLFVALLIFILLAGVRGYLAVILLVIAFLNIYIGVFTELARSQKIVTYTTYFFRCFNGLQFLCLLLSSALNIPFIQHNQNIVKLVDEVGALTSLEQLFLMLFIQLWLDLHSSPQFSRMSRIYQTHSLNREKVFLKGLAFQRNDKFIESLIREYKEVLSFDLSIYKAITTVKEWHASTSKDLQLVEYDFPGMRPGKYNQLIQKQIQEENLNQDHKQFSILFSNYIKSYTDAPLLYNYIEMLRYLIAKIQSIIFNEDLQLSCWSFIKEDYSFIEKLLQAYQTRLKEIVQAVGDADADEPMPETLLAIKDNFIGEEEQNPEIKVNLLTPSKLTIDIEPKPEHERISNYIFPFLVSNLDTIIILLTVIYYILNPCVLSLPLIAFIFLYYSIATRKDIHLMVIYLFLLILTTEIIMLVSDNDSDATIQGLTSPIRFFFPTDPNTGQTYYSQAYLYFYFVMIFLSQQVVKYKGNRYRTELQAQNLEQAFLRILMNEDINSKLNIWKYAKADMEVGEKYNPFSVATNEIDNNVEKLQEESSSFGQVFSDRKIGVDLYPLICSVQIILMIYMIFFYALMAYVQGFSIEDTTRYFQFSGDMVIGVLVHVLVMIIERYLAIAIIPRKSRIIIKYCFTIAIFLAFSFFIYYQAPIINFATYLFAPSPALIGFSFFYFIYFYLSALQIKYGYKEFKSLNSLMTRRGFINYYAITIYTAIPFLYQLKIIIDWTFSQTSLTLFDWFKQFSIYLRAFRAKIQYYNAISNPLNEEQPWYAKIIGWVGFIIIILIIFGPMILFSNLNPISEINLISSGSLSLALQVQGGNSFTLYSTSHFSTPPYNFTEEQFDSQGFSNVPTLQQLEQGNISQQFQRVTYEPYSDNNWGIANPNYLALLDQLNKTINQLQRYNKSSVHFQIAVTYQFQRYVVESISTSSTFVYPSVDGALDKQTLESIYGSLSTCDGSVSLPQFYVDLIRLNTEGNSYKPRPITFYNSTQNGTKEYPFVKPVTLTLNCPDNITNSTIADTNQVYWGLSLDQNQNEGLVFFVFCDKYQNVIAGYGFTALYTSIILVVAGFIRSLFDGNMPYIPYEMNPRSDNILRICEAISTLRIRKQFRQEYLMYYELIDLIRSPEIMKYMSGSYPYLIEQAYEESERSKRLKELEKNKKD